MNQEKFGQLIKEIRKKHNLTQKDLANKYHVTYQAVSKWENGKNMPDTALIKQISEDFNISLESLLDGEYKKKITKKLIYIIISTIIIIAIVIVSITLIIKNNNDFHFKTLSTSCDNFNISGNISYNEKKSAIYISNIEYCGGNDTLEYEKIVCTLYESNNDIEKKISTYEGEFITLEDFLHNITFAIDDYNKTCDVYNENSLYLIINATNKEDKITTYKIPLSLDNC